jgi:hypothetical protein
VDVLETPATRELEVVGERGIVVGISEENGERFVAVAIETLGRTVMLRATDVRATGRRVQPEEVYDGSSLRVTEEGRVVSDPDDDEDDDD